MYIHAWSTKNSKPASLSNYICANLHKKAFTPAVRLQPVAEGIYERDIDGKLCFPSATIPSLTSRKKAKGSNGR